MGGNEEHWFDREVCLRIKAELEKAGHVFDRTDYPLCPYCFSELSGFSPDSNVVKATLYCPNTHCVGMSICGLKGYGHGYDIHVYSIKNGTTKSVPSLYQVEVLFRRFLRQVQRKITAFVQCR